MPLGPEIYVPTLCMRPAELRGLEFLPSVAKDRMMPCFLFSPWTTARTLERGMERIDDAFPNRPFLLDLDRDYDGGDWQRPVQQDFLSLLNADDAYAAWWEHWIQYDHAIPCLQLVSASRENIEGQVSNLQAVGREFCLRLRLDRLPRNLDDIIDLLVEFGTAEYSVLVEGGWTSDPLTLSAQVSGLINNTLGRLDGRVPIVISCTSAPRDYTAFLGVTEVPFANRELLSLVRQNAQREVLIYGDWGSTKPRENGFGRTPLPRIDYPTANSWIIARNREEDWGFDDAARAIVESGYWTGGLGIWGEEMILETAGSRGVGINSPQKNVSARVNIHMYHQAMYGDDLVGLDLEEDWED
ncbi:beta family protein [Nioella nitratireducens]|uniref:beta family protein n=1 Tax=Nioella nitratireducens TaxID=1287720 RepID=UPI0009FFCA48|nr:beta family protein [Nioella nitratireducens]